MSVDANLRLTAAGRVVARIGATGNPGSSVQVVALDATKPVNLRWTWTMPPRTHCLIEVRLPSQGCSLNKDQLNPSDRAHNWEGSLRLPACVTRTYVGVQCTMSPSADSREAASDASIVRFYALDMEPSTAATSAAATSEPSFRMSTGTQTRTDRRHHPTDTTIPPSDAPLPKPTPGGEGAILIAHPLSLSDGAEVVGEFAKSCLLGKPPLQRPTPGRDGEVFLDDGSRGPRAFVKKLKGDLAGTSSAPSSPSEDEDEVELDEPDECEEEEHVQGGEEEDEDEDESAEPSEEDAEVKAESDGDDGTNDPTSATSEDTRYPAGLDQDCIKAQFAAMGRILGRGVVADMLLDWEPRPINLLRDHFPHFALASGADDHLFLRKLGSWMMEQAMIAISGTGGEMPLRPNKRKRTKSVSDAAGRGDEPSSSQPGTDDVEAPALRELPLTPLIKRLQTAQPHRAEQFAQAKPLLAAQHIAGDVVLALGTNGLHAAGVTLGVAASIVDQIRQDESK